MIRTYTDDVRELLDSGLVEIIKVKLFSVKYGEDDEIPMMDFIDDFKTLTQSGIFVNSVIWSFDTNTEEITPKCDLYIRGETDGEEEVLVYIKLDKESTTKEANEILLKWVERK